MSLKYYNRVLNEHKGYKFIGVIVVDYSIFKRLSIKEIEKLNKKDPLQVLIYANGFGEFIYVDGIQETKEWLVNGEVLEVGTTREQLYKHLESLQQLAQEQQVH